MSHDARPASHYCHCLGCHRRAKVPHRLLGQPLKCPRCGRVFTPTATLPLPESPVPRGRGRTRLLIAANVVVLALMGVGVAVVMREEAPAPQPVLPEVPAVAQAKLDPEPAQADPPQADPPQPAPPETELATVTPPQPRLAKPIPRPAVLKSPPAQREYALDTQRLDVVMPTGESDWSAGAAHPTFSHVEAAQVPGRWQPSPGYVWARDDVSSLAVQWEPGRWHRTEIGQLASTDEGQWQTTSADSADTRWFADFAEIVSMEYRTPAGRNRYVDLSHQARIGKLAQLSPTSAAARSATLHAIAIETAMLLADKYVRQKEYSPREVLDLSRLLGRAFQAGLEDDDEAMSDVIIEAFKMATIAYVKQRIYRELQELARLETLRLWRQLETLAPPTGPRSENQAVAVQFTRTVPKTGRVPGPLVSTRGVVFELVNTTGRSLHHVRFHVRTELAGLSSDASQHAIYLPEWPAGQKIEIPPALIYKALQMTSQKIVRDAVTYSIRCDELEQVDQALTLFKLAPKVRSPSPGIVTSTVQLVK